MLELSARNFGLLIAYIIPGFIALLGLSLVSVPVRLWLLGAGETGPSIGGVVYLLLACIAIGMAASAVRWAAVDTILHRCGLIRPVWDDARLMERLEAYQMLIDIHYRYYQFYANSLVAMLFSYGIKCVRDGIAFGWVEAGVIVFTIVFFAASRDALFHYYRRSSLLLGIQKGSGTKMTNGGHHDVAGGTSTSTKTGNPKASQAIQKPQAERQDTGEKSQSNQRPK